VTFDEAIGGAFRRSNVANRHGSWEPPPDERPSWAFGGSGEPWICTPGGRGMGRLFFSATGRGNVSACLLVGEYSFQMACGSPPMRTVPEETEREEVVKELGTVASF
jgi:hypothetical protein